MAEVRHYPRGQAREIIEMKIISSLVSEDQFDRVAFLQPNDFESDKTRAMFEHIASVKGNYREAIRKDPRILEMCYELPDFLFLQSLALLLVECNISSAICDRLERTAYDCKDQAEGAFLLEASQDGRTIDALKLHASVIKFIKPMASQKSLNKVTSIINRITNRIEIIKNETKRVRQERGL